MSSLTGSGRSGYSPTFRMVWQLHCHTSAGGWGQQYNGCPNLNPASHLWHCGYAPAILRAGRPELAIRSLSR